jgi:hypothetical protein
VKPVDASVILGYVISGVMSVAGVLILTGIISNEGMPPKVWITFGVVLVLFGVYRFVLTRMRASQAEKMGQ